MKTADSELEQFILAFSVHNLLLKEVLLLLIPLGLDLPVFDTFKKLLLFGGLVYLV